MNGTGTEERIVLDRIERKAEQAREDLVPTSILGTRAPVRSESDFLREIAYLRQDLAELAQSVFPPVDTGDYAQGIAYGRSVVAKDAARKLRRSLERFQ